MDRTFVEMPILKVSTAVALIGIASTSQSLPKLSWLTQWPIIPHFCSIYEKLYELLVYVKTDDLFATSNQVLNFVSSEYFKQCIPPSDICSAIEQTCKSVKEEITNMVRTMISKVDWYILMGLIPNWIRHMFIILQKREVQAVWTTS